MRWQYRILRTGVNDFVKLPVCHCIILCTCGQNNSHPACNNLLGMMALLVVNFNFWSFVYLITIKLPLVLPPNEKAASNSKNRCIWVCGTQVCILWLFLGHVDTTIKFLHNNNHSNTIILTNPNFCCSVIQKWLSNDLRHLSFIQNAASHS